MRRVQQRQWRRGLIEFDLKLGIDHSIKLLFVCSRNYRRSLTAEKIFSGIPGYESRSAGTQPGARIVVTPGHIGWADIIFVMEKSHLNRLRLKFSEALQNKTTVVLHIPDDYEFMQPELIDELKAKVMSYVRRGGAENCSS